MTRYLGHAPQTMAERHYHGEFSRTGQNLVDKLRINVTNHINSLVERCTILHDRAEVVELPQNEVPPKPLRNKQLMGKW